MKVPKLFDVARFPSLLRSTKTGLCCGVGLVAAVAIEPAAAQGDRSSQAIELAGAAQELAPGQWVLSPEIAPEGPVLVLVDLTAQLAFIYRNGINIGVSTISSGKPGHETPTGIFQILQKDADHRSSTYNNAPMFYQQRLTWDGVALHAGGLPGYPESHGCIHLPIEFARELFEITTMGGTIVVTGHAGVPVRALAGGVLAPLDELGQGLPHQPLDQDEVFHWDETAPLDGPLSIVLSTSDERVIVMRNGREIARARAEIEGHLGTHVAVLQRGADNRPHWMLVGVPGHEGEAHHPIDATALHRLRLPHGFIERLRPNMTVGTTVVITSAPVHEDNSGRGMTLLAAMQ